MKFEFELNFETEIFILPHSLNQVFSVFIRIHYVGWFDTLPVGSCGPQLSLIPSSAGCGFQLIVIEGWLVSRVKSWSVFRKAVGSPKGGVVLDPTNLYTWL